MTGVGQTTGITYHPVGVTQWEEHYDAESFPYTFTWINYWPMVGPGKGNNVYFVDKYHITVNANGEVTGEHAASDTVCH